MILSKRQRTGLFDPLCIDACRSCALLEPLRTDACRLCAVLDLFRHHDWLRRCLNDFRFFLITIFVVCRLNVTFAWNGRCQCARAVLFIACTSRAQSYSSRTHRARSPVHRLHIAPFPAVFTNTWTRTCDHRVSGATISADKVSLYMINWS